MFWPINSFLELYDQLWANRDVRVDSWPWMSSPIPTILMCILYVRTVKVWGPNFMKDRPPFQLRWLLIFYNLFQVFFSAWLFYECVISGWIQGQYTIRCQPVDRSDNPLAIRMAGMAWWYYFSKFTEFFDTFFFVLRKKQEHVSLLHVFHHGMMPFNTWLAARFLPGGHSAFVPLLNTFVHIFMYLYYLLAAMGPTYSKAIAPWKKYVTTLQLVQFVAVFTHAFQLFFTECDYPVSFAWWIGGHAVFFFILFAKFYVKSYVGKLQHRKTSTSKTSTSKTSTSKTSTTKNSTLVTVLKANGLVSNYRYTKPQYKTE